MVRRVALPPWLILVTACSGCLTPAAWRQNAGPGPAPAPEATRGSMTTGGSQAMAQDEHAGPLQTPAQSNVQQAQAIIAQSANSQPSNRHQATGEMPARFPSASGQPTSAASASPAQPEERIQSLAREASGQCQRTAT